MSMFGNIMNKIFHHPAAAAAPQGETPQGASPTLESGFDEPAPATAASAPASSAPASSAAASAPVDVGAVLSQMASTKGGGGNYQTSIVDLLKLLDLDSSLDARKQLAQELNVHAGADGSAEENVALHKAVCQKLAENGGVLPASMHA